MFLDVLELIGIIFIESHKVMFFCSQDYQFGRSGVSWRKDQTEDYLVLYVDKIQSE